MHHRTVRARLTMIATALVVMIIALVASTRRAGAQPPYSACTNGTYTVDLSAFTGPTCYPLSVSTSWASGAVVWPLTGPYTGPGVYVEAPPVPPGVPLQYIEVFGQHLPPGPVAYQKTINSPCGLICVSVCLDPSGCLYVKVYPGPCPPTTLPCP